MKHSRQIVFLSLFCMVFFAGNYVKAAEESVEKAKESGINKKPNIVFIFADDLGYGDLGLFGSSEINTPNIDRMGAEGIKFSEFYVASSICTPSRAALLTGRYPFRQGINKVFFPESATGMDPEEVTIAEVLKTVGYHTGIVGKWHLGHRDRYMPWNQGFDEFFGVPFSNDMGGLYYYRDQEVLLEKIDQRYMTQTYTDEAIKFIEKNAEQPFFLYLAHNMPHIPIYVSPAFEGKSKGGLYGDVVEEMDWSVGKILQKIEDLGLSENTLVVFTSDNGPWLMMGSHGGSPGILREGKTTNFDGGMRVPAVAYWKGVIGPGKVYSEMATMMDWLPTFAKLSGADLPTHKTLDGEDISQVLLADGKRKGDTLAYYFHDELNGSKQGSFRAYRSGDWKIKRPYQSPYGPLSWLHKGFPKSHDYLLFNLKDDPEERNNLAKHEPEKLKALDAEFQDFITSLGELPLTKENGKNMDFSGFARFGLIIVLKVALVIGGFIFLLAFFYRKYFSGKS